MTTKGESSITAMIVVLSLMGGIFTPIFGVTIRAVGYFIAPGFTSHMTKNLFLVDKNHQNRGLSSKATTKVKPEMPMSPNSSVDIGAPRLKRKKTKPG